MAIELDSSHSVQMATLYRSERCCQSVILQLLHRKLHMYLNSAAAQCHWSYRTLCCFCKTTWRIYGRDKPRGWWQHWPELPPRIQIIKPPALCEYGACSERLITIITFVLALRLYVQRDKFICVGTTHQILKYNNRHLYGFPFSLIT